MDSRSESSEGRSGNVSFPKPKSSDGIYQLRQQLQQLGLSTQGKKETLLRRTRKAWNELQGCRETTPDSKEALTQTQADFFSTTKGQYRSFLVLDVEATCESGDHKFGYPNEVIELPVVLLKWRARKRPDSSLDHDGEAAEGTTMELYVEDEFQTYVRPTFQPELSTYCTALTGIDQDTIDKAPTFPEAIANLEKWMTEHGLLSDGFLKDPDTDQDETAPFLWVTDGPYDIRDFIAKQCFISDINTPEYFTGDVLDIKTFLSNYFTRLWLDDQSKPPTSQSPSPPTPLVSKYVDLADPADPILDSTKETCITSASVAPTSPPTTPPTSNPKTLSPNIDPSFLPSYLLSSLSQPSSPRKASPKVKEQQAANVRVSEESTSRRGKKGKGKGKGKESPNFFGTIRKNLEKLGLGEFEGRQHSGIDDSRNIARLLIELARRNETLSPNLVIKPKSKTWPWMGVERGQIIWKKTIKS